MEEGKERCLVALITGAARRIGAGIARTLHGAGLRVVIHYRHSGAEAEALVAELNQQRANSAAVLCSNLTDPDSVRRLADQASAMFDGIDILVNNASSFYPTPLADASDADWDAIMHSNLRAPFLLSQRLAPVLAASGRGAIINIIDVYAEKPLRDHSLYCMAKAGLASMTRSLARELGPRVRVNGVSPGPILWPENGSTQQETILAATALGRSGDPADVAGAVTWLALHAPYVTGQILTVDGGRSLPLHGG